MASKKKQKLKLVQLSSVTYNPTTFMVTLLTRKKLALNPPLVLAVNASSLRDALGRELDGNDLVHTGREFHGPDQQGRRHGDECQAAGTSWLPFGRRR